MNETLNFIHNRHSLRNYAPNSITEEEKNAILAAAIRAPTAGNMMLYSIIEVEDKELKDQLAISCDNQPFIARAPLVLLFLADYQRWVDLFEFSDAKAGCAEANLIPRLPEEGDLLLASCDALIAAQTAVIAAESMGIGSCYIGDILENCETHRKMFNLPRYTLPITLLCFGRPAKEQENQVKISRFPREFIVSKDTYHRVADKDFAEMFKESTSRQLPALSPEDGVKTIGQRMYLRKFVSDFSVELSRSVREWMTIWTGKENG